MSAPVVLLSPAQRAALALLTPTTPGCRCGHPATAHRWAAHSRYAGCAACACWLFAPTPGPPPPWFDLSAPWPALCALGDARWAVMKDWPSCHHWAGPTDRLGTQGEALWALYSGQALDLGWWLEGDPGMDFPGIDVKARPAGPEPRDLLVPDPVRPKPWPAWFALVVIDAARQGGRLVGVTPSAPVLAHPRRDFGKGAGLQHWLPARYLRPPSLYFAWLAAAAAGAVSA